MCLKRYCRSFDDYESIASGSGKEKVRQIRAGGKMGRNFEQIILIMKSSSQASKENICCICMEELQDTSVNCCTHRFCFHCIHIWTKERNSCPICRARIRRIKNDNGTSIPVTHKRRKRMPFLLSPSSPVPPRTQTLPQLPSYQNFYNPFFIMPQQSSYLNYMPMSAFPMNNQMYQYPWVPFSFVPVLMPSSASENQEPAA